MQHRPVVVVEAVAEAARRLLQGEDVVLEDEERERQLAHGKDAVDPFVREDLLAQHRSARHEDDRERLRSLTLSACPASAPLLKRADLRGDLLSESQLRADEIYDVRAVGLQRLRKQVVDLVHALLAELAHLCDEAERPRKGRVEDKRKVRLALAAQHG